MLQPTCGWCSDAALKCSIGASKDEQREFSVDPIFFFGPIRPSVGVTLAPGSSRPPQILSPLGRISEALADLTKAIQLQPSARLYRHRGTLLFISEVWSLIKCWALHLRGFLPWPWPFDLSLRLHARTMWQRWRTSSSPWSWRKISPLQCSTRAWPSFTEGCSRYGA